MTSQFGGAWLLGETSPGDVFRPEDRNDEHRMISATAQAFIEQEVIPRSDALEAKDWAVARQLMRQCGELGLLGVDVPEDFGGVGLDTVSSVLVSEAMGRHASFATTAGAHMGLCVVPLLWFGTPAQRSRYLPGLVSGEIVGAYGLSEAGSGIGRAGGACDGNALARRRLRTQWGEALDHQLRVRGPLRGVREGKRRAFHGLPRATVDAWRHARSRGAQDGPARLVDGAVALAGRTRRRRCRAR